MNDKNETDKSSFLGIKKNLETIREIRIMMNSESTICLKNAKFLYHGTDSNHLRGINERKALVPPSEHDLESNYGMSLKSAIYLTTSITRAIFWARMMVDKNGGDRIILKIPKEAVIGKLCRDRNLMWDETSFQVEDVEIKNFEVIEEEDFWNEIRKALGFANGVPSRDYVEIRYAIEKGMGIRVQLEEIPDEYKTEIGFLVSNRKANENLVPLKESHSFFGRFRKRGK